MSEPPFNLPSPSEPDWMGEDGNRGLVSVIIPTYNRSSLLEQALRSVKKQTYRPLEVIVVDDGSTDKTPSVVQRWKTKNETDSFQVRLHRQENHGVGTARNQGLRMARGEFIQFLDSDDCLSERKIETQVNTLSEKKDRVAFCETRFFEDRAALEEKKSKPTGGRAMSSSDDPVSWLLKLFGWDGQKGMVGIHGWLVPRNIIREAGRWRRALVCDDDGEYFCRVVLASSGVVRTDGLAYYRRHTGERLSPRRSASDWRDQLVATRLKEKRLLEAAEDRQETVQVHSFASRQYMQVAYQTYPTYPVLSAVAERWAESKKKPPILPSPKSKRARFARKVLGWRGHRIMSSILHNENFWANAGEK